MSDEATVRVSHELREAIADARAPGYDDVAIGRLILDGLLARELLELGNVEEEG